MSNLFKLVFFKIHLAKLNNIAPVSNSPVLSQKKRAKNTPWKCRRQAIPGGCLQIISFLFSIR